MKTVISLLVSFTTFLEDPIRDIRNLNLHNYNGIWYRVLDRLKLSDI